MSARNTQNYRIFALGPGALTVEFGNAITVALNELAIASARTIEDVGFPGLIEAVPAYSSVTVFYDVSKVRAEFPFAETAFGAVADFVSDIVATVETEPETSRHTVEIGVKFGDAAGPDLEFVARNAGLSSSEVIRIFTSQVYRVYMLGFLPGFAYLGELDERIASPRKKTPRAVVPAGSVAIAGRQAGIYPVNSPGGWQLIGQTDFSLFSCGAMPPCPLRPGDAVRFFEIKE